MGRDPLSWKHTHTIRDRDRSIEVFEQKPRFSIPDHPSANLRESYWSLRAWEAGVPSFFYGQDQNNNAYLMRDDGTFAGKPQFTELSVPVEIVDYMMARIGNPETLEETCRVLNELPQDLALLSPFKNRFMETVKSEGLCPVHAAPVWAWNHQHLVIFDEDCELEEIELFWVVDR